MVGPIRMVSYLAHSASKGLLSRNIGGHEFLYLCSLRQYGRVFMICGYSQN